MFHIFQSSQQGRASTSNSEISVWHDVSQAGGSGDLSYSTEILSSKMKAAGDWMQKFQLVGRQSEMSRLHESAADHACYSYYGRVMSVWGIAGVGKSALVKNFYCETMCQKDQFNKYGWVQVTQPFDLRGFCRSLLWDFRSESLQAMDTAYHGAMGSKNPIHECCKLLKNYRCLVVIDDLQSTEDWDLITAQLETGYSKSVIVVITTEAKIAAHCADHDELVLNVKGLEDNEAFDLFSMEVHRNNRYCPFNSRDRELQELILKCGGLPKVIVAIARLLATKMVTLMDTASSLNLRFMHELETNREFVSLRGLFGWMQSYFRTSPDFLKPCIFYLSIFFTDHKVRRRRLVRRWIAEGYATDSDDKSAEENGEDYFSNLLDRNFIQGPPHLTTNLNDTRVALCQVNGFFREYILSQRTEDNLIFELRGSCSLTTQRTGRHLIILESWDRDKIVFNSIDFSRLRSMTVFGKWKSFFISNNMKLLRVLDLENAEGVMDDDLDRMVKVLHRLKFLSIRGCHEISHLPTSVGDLRQLQSLDVRHTSVVIFPANIANLQKLQYIRAGNTTKAQEPSTPCFPLSKLCRQPQHKNHLVGVEVPGGIEKLTALHTLGVVNISASGGRAILKELKKLTQLRKLGVSGINRKNRDEFCSAISSHSHLESLSVWLDKDSENCFDGISLPLKNVRSLKLYGLGDKLPEGIKELCGNYRSKLTKLGLEMDTLKEDGIAVLGDVPKLFTLRVNQCQDGNLNFCVEKNGRELRTYQKVRILEIACSSSLQVAFGSETMQNLEQLKVDCCNGSSVKFPNLENLSQLKEVVLKGCRDEKLTEELQGQLLRHPNKPALKLKYIRPGALNGHCLLNN